MQDIMEKRSQGITKFLRQKENIIRDAITAISVCHNVTPVMDEGKQVNKFTIFIIFRCFRPVVLTKLVWCNKGQNSE